MMNTQAQETQHFNSLAHQWWDKQGKFKVLHEVNPLRMSFIQANDSLQGKRILDVGCGGGILSEALRVAGAEVVGLDLSEKSIEVAQQHASENSLDVRYICSSVEDLAQHEAGTFDMVCCFEMLEHVDDPKAIVQSISKLLKPQGVFFASTLNRNLLSWFFGIIIAENVLNWIPKNTHNHGKFIKPSELTAMARASDFHFTHSKGIIWDPLTQNFKLSDERLEINYMCRFTLLP